MPDDTLARRLAQYCLSLKFNMLSQEAVHEVKRRIIDSFGCALGARTSPPALAAARISPGPNARYRAHMIGQEAPTTPDHAAFVNGTMVRYLDFNDTYLSKEPAHPSDNIPAAFAAAEAAGRDGEALITAIAAAYEIQCRLCDAASLRARGWDHVTYGAFSATAAASMLLGLTEDEFVNALGIAGTTGAALRQTRAGQLSMWKGAAFANASRNAIFSAMLAKAGMSGPAPIFEGEFGFERLVSGPLAFEGGSDGGKILETYIKYYPAEYHAQSAIGAAIDLSSEIKDTSLISTVKVRTFGAAYEIIGSGPEKWRPRTRETADHSLPFCVAAALMDGGITLETFSDKRLQDRRLLDLTGKIEVIKDEDLDRMYPEAMPNRVEVVLSSGKVMKGEIIYPKGHSKNPLTDPEVEEKFMALSAGHLSEAQAGRALEAAWAIDKQKDLSKFMDLFRR